MGSTDVSERTINVCLSVHWRQRQRFERGGRQMIGSSYTFSSRLPSKSDVLKANVPSDIVFTQYVETDINIDLGR